MEWLTNNWVHIVAILWSLDQLLKVVAQLTPTKVDDNIADILGKILARFFPQKQ